MTVVTGFKRSPECEAALERAIEEARLRDTDLLVVHSMRGGERDEVEQVLANRDEFARLEQRLTNANVRFELIDYARGNTPAQDIVSTAIDHDAELIVIGMRRRTTVGKLVLGSNANDILLRAPCPVLAVRASPSDEAEHAGEAA